MSSVSPPVPPPGRYAEADWDSVFEGDSIEGVSGNLGMDRVGILVDISSDVDQPPTAEKITVHAEPDASSVATHSGNHTKNSGHGIGSASNHTRNYGSVIVEELPIGAQGYEMISHSHMYPATALGHDLQVVHNTYKRRMDRFQPSLEKKNVNRREPSEPLSVVLEVTTTNGRTRKFGNANTRSPFKLKFLADAQMPALVITIKLEDGTTDRPKRLKDCELVHCYIFGAAIETHRVSPDDDPQMALEMLQSGDETACYEIMDRYTLPSVFSSKKQLCHDVGNGTKTIIRTDLWAWTLQQTQQEDKDREISGVQRIRPVWHGIDQDRLVTWAEKLPRIGKSNLGEVEEALACLYDMRFLRAYAVVPYGWAAEWSAALCNFMQSSMAASCLWGLFWQYELQARHVGRTLASPGVVSEVDFAVPRHLVKKWKVLKTRDGQAINSRITPVEWGSFNLPAVFPFAHIAAFVVTLGEHREAIQREMLVGKAVASNRNAIAKISPHPYRKIRFWASIETPNLQADETSTAELCGLNPIFLVDAGPFSFKIPSARDSRNPDFKVHAGDIRVAGARTILQGWFQVQKPHSGFNSDETYSVELSLPDRSRVNGRRISAIHEVARWIPDHFGANLSAVLFRVTMPMMRTDDSMSSRFTDLKLRILMEDCVKKYRLDMDQMRTVRKIFNGGRGWLLCHSTSKAKNTALVLAMGDALVNHAGLTVAFIAKNETQVDTTMNMWSKDAGTEGHGNDYARPRNAHFQSLVLQHLAGIPDHGIDLAKDGVGSMPFDEGHGFAAHFVKKLKTWSKLPTDLGSKAMTYLREAKALMTMGDMQTKTNLLNSLNTAEAFLVGEVCRTVRVWFSATDSVEHSKIVGHAQPDVLLIEEADQISSGELAMVLAAYGSSLKVVVMVGDMNERPIFLSKERNEVSDIMSVSAFQHLASNGPAGNFDQSLDD